MSSLLCFVCHSTVNADTHEETREKYRDVIGMNLCPDSHLCYICSYFLHKMWMFKSICLKRSQEYPVLFSEKENEISSANEDELPSAEENLNLSTIEESETTESKPKKRKGKESFEKILLTVEEQKMELEKARKEEKYIAASFKCYSCAMYFHFKDSYQTHMMRHEESNGEYFCSICSLRFANPAVLRSHTANHSARYRCATCGDTVRPRQRETHERQCAGERDSVSCHLCGRVFQGVQHFQQHMRRFHSVGPARDVRHRCNVCGASCASRRHLRTHLITHINRKFDCDQCSSTFSSPYTLTRHKKSKHHPAEPDLHRCSTCQITYNSRKSLAQHMRTALAHKETVYKCASCGRVCPSLSSLQAHTAALHTRPRHLACKQCNKRYSTTKALVRHMSTHKADRLPLPLCHACGATFKNASVLKKHLKNVCEKEKRKCQIIEDELLQVPFFE